MSSLLPIRSEPSTGGQEPRIVDLEGDDAEEVFSALSSTTARRIVAELHDEPRAQSEIAEELDTTVQNVRYHLDNLEDAGLVEVVDTWYSSRGNEMKVYAPADGALIVSGDEGTASRLRTALSRLVGGVAVLGLASLLLQTLIDRFGPTVGKGVVTYRGDGGDGGDAAGGAAGAPTETTSELDGARDQSTEAAGGGDGGAAETEVYTTTQGARDTTTATQTPTQTQTATQTETAVESTRTATSTATETSTETAIETATETATASPTGTPTAEATTTVVGNVTDTPVEPTTVSDAATATDPGTLPPGALFFLGGASVLVVVTTVWYLSGR